MAGIGVAELVVIGVLALLGILVAIGAVLGVYWLLTRSRK